MIVDRFSKQAHFIPVDGKTKTGTHLYSNASQERSRLKSDPKAPSNALTTTLFTTTLWPSRNFTRKHPPRRPRKEAKAPVLAWNYWQTQTNALIDKNPFHNSTHQNHKRKHISHKPHMPNHYTYLTQTAMKITLLYTACVKYFKGPKRMLQDLE